MVRIGMDDEINYRYGTGPKPPHMTGTGDWGPTRAQEARIRALDLETGCCSCLPMLPCTCGRRKTVHRFP
jgi:hypothetical protein